MIGVYRGACIGNWDLNGNGDDAGLNDLDATAENMEWGVGKFGGCGVFDGVDARLSLANNALLKPTSFSVMGWYKSSSANSNQTLIQNMANVSSKLYGWTCAFQSGYVRFIVAKGTGVISGTDYVPILGSTLVNDDVLHFLTYTYNGTSKSMKIYVDGKLDESGTSNGLVYTGTQYPNIGVREDSSATYSYYLTGNASNITLLDYDMTDAEIRHWFTYCRGMLI